jgi:hypothetical protein
VKAKGNPLSLLTFHHNTSLMGLSYGLGYGKAKATTTGGTGTGRIAAIKSLEHLLYFLF